MFFHNVISMKTLTQLGRHRTDASTLRRLRIPLGLNTWRLNTWGLNNSASLSTLLKRILSLSLSLLASGRCRPDASTLTQLGTTSDRRLRAYAFQKRRETLHYMNRENTIMSRHHVMLQQTTRMRSGQTTNP